MSISGKYVSPSNPDSFVFATWEKNGKNTKIYAGGKLIYSTVDPTPLKEGVTTDAGVHGKVKALLINNQLHIEVDGMVYEAQITGNKPDFRGLIRIFWILFVFSAVVNFFELLAWAPFIGRVPEVTVSFIIEVFCTLIYLTTAILMMKKVYWSYFLGAGLFALTTTMMLFNLDIIMSSFILILVFLVRIGFLFLIIRGGIDVVKSMRQAPSDEGVLDSGL